MNNATADNTTTLVTADQQQHWQDQGYLIMPSLFNSDEVAKLRQFFAHHEQTHEPIPGHWEPMVGPDARDASPLEQYPRMMHPHRFADLPKAMMLHPRLGAALQALVGDDMVAVQSMIYFKPPGAKGQALHQDNLYLQVKPDTCYAAWIAIDPADTENGGMYVVPGTHKLDILCPESADLNESFTNHLVNAPKGMQAVPAKMQPGDVLFFNGSVVHGSGKNKTANRWRRSFICHYMPRSSTQIAEHYFPVLDFAGNEIPYDAATDGGPCGSDVKVRSYGESFEPAAKQ